MILSHFVILAELTSDTDIKSILKVRNLVLVQVGDDELFLHGHVSQDFMDDLVDVVGVGDNFTLTTGTKDTLILVKPISSVKIKMRTWDVTWELMSQDNRKDGALS